MASQITEQIKERLDIVDVLGGYLALRKSGANYKAVCPFHHEKSGSLMVSPVKQIWHCFGCGEGGDIFGFVMKQEGVEFKEALKLLAERAGVALSTQVGNPEQKQEVDQLIRINAFTAKYFEQVLSSSLGTHALAYLKNRGLTDETLQNWGIGYAPDSFSALLTALSKKGVSNAEALKAGVCAQSEKGKIYDRFRARITFPIADSNGKIVGFTARTLDPDAGAKYINSPETLIYQKSKILFGLDKAKAEIRKHDYAVVVEGQMDVIALHQAGYKNVVASSGTALTEQQLQVLARMSKNLMLCFDSDSAGSAASYKGGLLALSQGFKVKVITIVDAKDPDELVKANPKAWQGAVKAAVLMPEVYITLAKKKFEFGSLQQKQYISETVVPILAALQDAIELDHYIRIIAQDFQMSESTLREKLRSQVSTSALPKISTAPTSPSLLQTTEQGSSVEEKFVYGTYLLETGYRAFIEDKLENPSFSADMEAKGLVAAECVFMVESDREALHHDEGKFVRILTKNLLILKLADLKKQQQELNKQLSQASLQDRDTAVKTELATKFTELTLKRGEIEKDLTNI